MTVLFDDHSQEPGTHVLIIAVGDYPFLKDGSAPPELRFANHMNMGQLSSPPISALELANWFANSKDGYHNPDKPCRSIAMLSSAAAPQQWIGSDKSRVPLARATLANADAAINAWMLRCNSDPENLAVFYFCGHGLAFSESENSLLLEDFGSHTTDPSRHAIFFDEMRLGLMQHCDARYQCHFIDACRTLPTKTYSDTYADDAGQRILNGRLTNKIRNKSSPVFFAAGLAAAAYGLDGQATLFTQGMFKAFRGAGSRDSNNCWDVSVPALAEGINKGIESLAFVSQPQYCQPRETGEALLLHRLRRLPEVIVRVATQDEGLMPKVVLSYAAAGNAKPSVRAQPHPSPWWLPLPLGSYTFQATALGTEQIVGQKTREIMPPHADVRL